MVSYCAFLRGVNVKGTAMKMEDVRKVFQEAGVSDVVSVLATGNILFKSELSKAKLKPILENALSNRFNYEAFLFLKTKSEIENIFNKKPFEANTDRHCYVFLGVEGIEKTLLKEFENSEKTEGEQASIIGETFYWQVPKGLTLDSSFGKILGRKTLKDKITSRNINTFEKILKKF